MGLCMTAQAQLEAPRRLRQWSGTAGSWLRITLVSFLATLPVEQLRAFPSSLSDCQTPTGWNCSGESHDGRVVVFMLMLYVEVRLVARRLVNSQDSAALGDQIKVEKNS